MLSDMAATRTARSSALANLRQAYVQLDEDSRLVDAVEAGSHGQSNLASSPPSCEPEPAESCLEFELEAVAQRTNAIRLDRQASYGRITSRENDPSKPICHEEVHSWVLQQLPDSTVLRPIENASAWSPKRKSQKGTDLVLHLRKMPFDNGELMHSRMLRTVFTKLTHNRICPSIGNHWEALGFQGSDPRTDLNRSGGILNVIHLFFFLAHYLTQATSCWHLSQDDTQNFPLACISINLTNMVVECLAAGCFSSVCRKQCDSAEVFEMTCRLHAAGLLHFCSRWKSQKRTIMSTEQTLREVRTILERKPAKLLAGLEQASIASSQSSLKETTVQFSDLEAVVDAPKALLPTRHRLWALSRAALPKRLRSYTDENSQALHYAMP
jgi:hypothetical protein